MLRTMPPLSVEERTRLGLRAAGSHMYQQDKVWSRYSNDKVDIAGALARVLRTLNKALPLDEPLRALSIGSSNEPQFRILESAFRAGSTCWTSKTPHWPWSRSASSDRTPARSGSSTAITTRHYATRSRCYASAGSISMAGA